MQPKSVYNYLIDQSNESMAPMDIKQVQNKKYNDNKRDRQNHNTGMYRNNFADNVQGVENMVYTHPFVQQVIHTKDKVPTVILYTQEQLLDIERSCMKQGIVLGFDKTFNLSKDVHVTACAFKQQSVKRVSTREHPIFLGPMMLHGSSVTETYATFFNHLSSELQATDCENLVIGTDNELSMRKGIRQGFPKATQVLCTRHLRQNAEQKLSDHCGVEKKCRNQIIDKLFGDNGIANADDTLTFDLRCEDLKVEVRDKVPQFSSYLENKLLPLIHENVNKPKRNKDVVKNWTNNNCESANHLLKLQVNWKPQTLMNLVDHLYSIVKSQYKDLQRATFGLGNFKLAEDYLHHFVNPSIWAMKSAAEKQSLFHKFLKDSKSGLATKFTLSTDGEKIVKTPKNGGKKPGQRKRKRTAKTTTMKNAKARKLNMDI